MTTNYTPLSSTFHSGGAPESASRSCLVEKDERAQNPGSQPSLQSSVTLSDTKGFLQGAQWVQTGPKGRGLEDSQVSAAKRGKAEDSGRTSQPASGVFYQHIGDMEHQFLPNSMSFGENPNTLRKTATRALVACESCRRSKRACVVESEGPNVPCKRCWSRGARCSLEKNDGIDYLRKPSVCIKCSQQFFDTGRKPGEKRSSRGSNNGDYKNGDSSSGNGGSPTTLDQVSNWGSQGNLFGDSALDAPPMVLPSTLISSLSTLTPQQQLEVEMKIQIEVQLRLQQHFFMQQLQMMQGMDPNPALLFAPPQQQQQQPPLLPHLGLGFQPGSSLLPGPFAPTPATSDAPSSLAPPS